MYGIVDPEIVALQKVVNQAYVKFGFASPEYNDAFDILHDARMFFMAEQYRKTNGLLPGAKTPYCDQGD